MKNKLFNEQGQALIIIALAAVGLFAIVGLAIDGSAKFSDQRHAQNAADTAAMAAALAKLTALKNPPSGVNPNDPPDCPPSSGVYSTACTALQNAGYARATSNGYDGNLVTNTVEIYSPPTSGPYAGNESYVQVIITSWVRTTFARVIGITQTQNIVQATAFLHVGGNLAEGAMLISYDPTPNCSTSGTGGYSVSVSGTSTVTLSGGGIWLNSGESCGFIRPNCANDHPNLVISPPAGISSVGADNIDQDGCSDPAPELPNQNPVVIPDEVYWPGEPPECGMSGPSHNPYQFPDQIYSDIDSKWHDQWLIYPGFYTDFPPASLLSNKSFIYMASGVYCIDTLHDADVSWSPVDAAFLNGSTDPTKNPYASYNPDGVTLYIKPSGGFSINTNSPTYLDASTTGDLQGYLIILEGTPTNHPSCTINGGADIDINGMIFAPYCNFTINGKAGETASINAQLLGWDIKVNGSNTINFNYDPSNQVKIKSKLGLVR